MKKVGSVRVSPYYSVCTRIAIFEMPRIIPADVVPQVKANALDSKRSKVSGNSRVVDSMRNMQNEGDRTDLNRKLCCSSCICNIGLS